MMAAGGEKKEVPAWVLRICGAPLMLGLGQLRPDIAPVIGAQVFAGNGAGGGALDGDAALDRDAFVPIDHLGHKRGGNFDGLG